MKIYKKKEVRIFLSELNRLKMLWIGVEAHKKQTILALYGNELFIRCINTYILFKHK